MPQANPYSVHPGVLMTQSWVVTLREKTGRSLDEWLRFIQESGPETEKERRDWLKNEHKLGTNSAWWLAERSAGKGDEEDSPEAYLAQALVYVDEMFADGKAPLRPLYEELLALCLSIGPDVKACPAKTIVPLYRNHVFAQIKPTTRTRIDLGFALKDTPATGRLIDTGGFAKKDRITHRIPITSLAEIDDEVQRWLRAAYEMDS
jgi:Domain of unknown function (DUF5655)/Domain of unknown function (DUF4287)